MKKLLFAMMLMGSAALGQTTTGTVQRLGDNLWQFNFLTQPAPQIQVYRPLQVPLIDTFRPFNQAIQNYGYALQTKRALDLEAARIKAESDAQRSFNDVLRMIYQGQSDSNKQVKAADEQDRIDQCVGRLLRIKNQASVETVRVFCEEYDVVPK